MTAFHRSLAFVVTSTTIILACLLAPVVWWFAQDAAEDALMTSSIQAVQQWAEHPAFQPQGAQAVARAQSLAQALSASHFDSTRVLDANGNELAAVSSAAAQGLLAELPAPQPPAYSQAYFERRQLPGRRWVVRSFIPLGDAQRQLIGYVEGVRLLTDAQRGLQQRVALVAVLLSSAALALCGAIIYFGLRRLALHAEQKTQEVLTSHIAMMEALGRAVARRDSDDGAHNYRVAWIAATLADAVGVHGSRMQELIAGSFLHDVGKIGIPEAILLKPERLNDEEMAVMRTHVSQGEAIVAGAGWLEGGLAVVANHHEKWDGSGYPRGLKGRDIPLVARIFAIADVFDALCAKRPFKKPLPLAEALDIVRDGAGQHFDPHLVEVFVRQAAHIHRTIFHTTEEQARSLLEAVMRQHFGR